MKLEIPEDERTLLRKWLVDGNEPIGEVLTVLEAAQPSLRKPELARHLVEKVQIPQPTAEDLVNALINIARTAARRGSGQAFALDLFRSVVGDVADADKRSAFDALVDRIVACKTLGVTGKALHVALDNQNTYCTARTLTELRPVYSDAEEDEPSIDAMMVVHNLKLVYHTGPRGEREELFLTLDQEAVSHLQRVLTRAQEKQGSLLGLVQRLEVPLLSGGTHE